MRRLSMHMLCTIYVPNSIKNVHTLCFVKDVYRFVSELKANSSLGNVLTPISEKHITKQKCFFADNIDGEKKNVENETLYHIKQI